MTKRDGTVVRRPFNRVWDPEVFVPDEADVMELAGDVESLVVTERALGFRKAYSTTIKVRRPELVATAMFRLEMDDLEQRYHVQVDRELEYSARQGASFLRVVFKAMPRSEIGPWLPLEKELEWDMAKYSVAAE